MAGKGYRLRHLIEGAIIGQFDNLHRLHPIVVVHADADHRPCGHRLKRHRPSVL